MKRKRLTKQQKIKKYAKQLFEILEHIINNTMYTKNEDNFEELLRYEYGADFSLKDQYEKADQMITQINGRDDRKIMNQYYAVKQYADKPVEFEKHINRVKRFFLKGKK